MDSSVTRSPATSRLSTVETSRTASERTFSLVLFSIVRDSTMTSEIPKTATTTRTTARMDRMSRRRTCWLLS